VQPITSMPKEDLTNRLKTAL